MNEYPPTAVDGELVDSIFVYQDANATGGQFCYLPRDLGWVADSSGEPDVWVDIGQKNNALYLKAQICQGLYNLVQRGGGVEVAFQPGKREFHGPATGCLNG